MLCASTYTENEIFLIWKEIQMGSVAKSFLRASYYEEMRKYLTIYEEAVCHT